MDFQTVITFAAAVFALAVKPGPGMMTIISRTMTHGISACFLFVTGLCIVSFFYLGLVLFGLRFAEEDLLFISILLKSCAAVYLIYLGVKGLMNPDFQFGAPSDEGEPKEQKLFDTFTGAVMVSLSNPLLIVFYGGLVPSIVDVSTIHFVDIAIMCAIIAVIELGVALAYCAPVAYSRHFVKPEMLRKITIGASIVLILVGLFIGYSALPAQDVVSVVQ